ncbi:MAG TPA: helix-turn-helix domain-containing protein [Pseudonocardiaceae bacterium]|nr:helix-turn-helix domain-containing protein [Pseudonocardiaceae bacterium]
MTMATEQGSASAARRRELAAFLRSRRERITPADVGMPPGLRRRTPGLRREEVAQLAGVGVTWYTWLEQGRKINASVQVLDSVARTLLLDSAERSHLHRLAGVPEVGPADGEQILEPEIQQILDGIAVPAAVWNTRYDVLAWNNPYALMWPHFIERGELNLVALPVTRDRAFGNPAVGRVVYRVTTLAVTATPETYINVFTPADDVSRERIAWLLAHPDEIPAPHHPH